MNTINQQVQNRRRIHFHNSKDKQMNTLEQAASAALAIVLEDDHLGKQFNAWMAIEWHDAGGLHITHKNQGRPELMLADGTSNSPLHPALVFDILKQFDTFRRYDD